MNRFWLATWKVDPPSAPTHQTAQPLIAWGAEHLAVEVIDAGALQAVLFSTADDADAPHALTCRIGFTSSAVLANEMRGRGFPMVDAAITLQGQTLEVSCPFFPRAPGAITYGASLFRLEGLVFGPSASASALSIVYDQAQEAPDPVDPAVSLLRKLARWEVERNPASEMQPAPEVQLVLPPARSPDLVPLCSGPLRLRKAWWGQWGKVQPKPMAGAPLPVGRDALYGAARFAFNDIEVIGFRIDLAEKAGGARFLASLMKPLNDCVAASWDPDDGPPPFRYVPATTVVLVELLRYGKMSLQQPLPPLDAQDYEGQHELVLRVMVAKRIAGIPQLSEPQVYIPAIVVDNTWSKIIGRDLQGFEKCLAEFCVDDGGTDVALLPDGRLPAGTVRPLMEIARVNLVSALMGGGPSLARAMVTFELPFTATDVWTRGTQNDSSLLPRWRLTDFMQRELMSSQFLDALMKSLTSFVSVQASPVDARDLPPCLLVSDCDLSKLSWSTPSRTAEMRLHATQGASVPWLAMCAALDIPPGSSALLTFRGYDWYRMRFSMGFVTRHGLAVSP